MKGRNEDCLGENGWVEKEGEKYFTLYFGECIAFYCMLLGIYSDWSPQIAAAFCIT